MASTVRDGIFATALKNAKAPSGPFPFTVSEDFSIQDMSGFEKQIITRIRQTMDEKDLSGSSWFRLEEKAASCRQDARKLLDTGQVAAVDGTNAMRPTALMATGAFVVAAGYLTSQARSTPHIRLTCTSTRFKDPSTLTDDELLALCHELAHARNEESWPTTFREYQERELALTCGTEIVLIDGPIFTQNLLTQSEGRFLYDRMLSNSSRYIGIIKDLISTQPLDKMYAYALQPGEGYVFPPVRDEYHERYQKVQHVRDWTDTLSEDFVRVVFRPKQKSFGLECRIQDLPMAAALVLENASPTTNHELPLLMELIDAQLRATYKGGDMVADQMIAKIQRLNFMMGVDVTSERNYR